jgi:hypothetical protein
MSVLRHRWGLRTTGRVLSDARGVRGAEQMPEVIGVPMAKRSVILGALFLLACGGRQTATTPDPDASDTSVDSTRDVTDDIDSNVSDTAVDADCAPDAPGGYAIATCCNGVPCAGDCTAGSDGKFVCACFGLTGGCTADSVCCKARVGCTTYLTCDRSH